MKANQAAFDVGQLAQNMFEGYYAHVAAISIVNDPRSDFLAPPILPDQMVPVGYITRNDGTKHVFHFLHFLEKIRNDPVISAELERIWLAGAILKIGDALALHNYFDRAPELELVRHLRNGIAHGNVFRIDNPISLSKYPAHNKLAWVRSDLKTDFTIEPALHGKTVLFDFIGPGDVIDLFMSLSLYLTRMGNGDPLRR